MLGSLTSRKVSDSKSYILDVLRRSFSRTSKITREKPRKWENFNKTTIFGKKDFVFLLLLKEEKFNEQNGTNEIKSNNLKKYTHQSFSIVFSCFIL